MKMIKNIVSTILVLTGLMALAGCERPPISGSVDSGVRLLQLGMTEAQVSSVIGGYQFESFDPSNGSASCRSYQYDEVINLRYVHVFFYDGRVTQASDQHLRPCVFAPDTL